VFENLLDSLSAYKNYKLNKTKPGYGPSDHASFYSKNIPVLFFFSGFHDEYHTPEDTWKLINLKGQKQILNLAYDIVFNLSRSKNPPSFSEAGPKNKSVETRSSFKVTFGIVPSYSSTVVGLEIDQISDSEGPAAKAGIISGDVIKSINGKKVNDIYEYMERLRELKQGIQVPVKINRNNLEIELNVTL
jgi:C-terminal processing protease CtpA/Prc